MKGLSVMTDENIAALKGEWMAANAAKLEIDPL